MREDNNNGQMQLLEVILVAGMVLISLFFVRSLNISLQTSTVERENKLEQIGDSILESLASRDSSNGDYSELGYYIKYFLETGRFKWDFEDYIELSLPSDSLYTIYIVNMTNFSFNPHSGIDNHLEYIYSPDYWIVEEACSSRIVVVDGFVYEIYLGLWFNIGGA